MIDHSCRPEYSCEPHESWQAYLKQLRFFAGLACVALAALVTQAPATASTVTGSGQPASTAPATEGTISGKAKVLDSATLSINGQTIRLFDLNGRGGALADELQAFLDSQGGTAICIPEQRAYRCRLPNGLDIGRVVLFNGAAAPAEGASEDYVEQSRAASVAHRGIWRDHTGDVGSTPTPAQQPSAEAGHESNNAPRPATAPLGADPGASDGSDVPAPLTRHHYHGAKNHEPHSDEPNVPGAADERSGGSAAGVHVPGSMGGGVHIPGSLGGGTHLPASTPTRGAPGAHQTGHARRPAGTHHLAGSQSAAHGGGPRPTAAASPESPVGRGSGAPSPPPPPVASAPPENAEVSSVDEALRRLAQGCVAFNVPDHMRLGRSQAVHANISPDASCKNAVQSLHDMPNVETAPLRLSMIMRGTLSGGEAFAISPSEQQSQMISETDITSFAWQVTPKQTGQQVLMLRFDLMLKAGGKEGSRTITSLERRIMVEVGWPKFLSEWTKVFRDVGEFIGWTIPAILAVLALLGFDWAKRAKRKVDDPANANPDDVPAIATTSGRRSANPRPIAADHFQSSRFAKKGPPKKAKIDATKPPP